MLWISLEILPIKDLLTWWLSKIFLWHLTFILLLFSDLETWHHNQDSVLSTKILTCFLNLMFDDVGYEVQMLLKPIVCNTIFFTLYFILPLEVLAIKQKLSSSTLQRELLQVGNRTLSHNFHSHHYVFLWILPVTLK